MNFSMLLLEATPKEKNDFSHNGKLQFHITKNSPLTMWRHDKQENLQKKNVGGDATMKFLHQFL